MSAVGQRNPEAHLILLTGATGTVGSAAAAALQAAGAPFRVGARSPAKAQPLGVPVVEFDWDRPETFEPAFRGAENVFLLTPVSEKQPEYGTADAEPGLLFPRLHRAAERAIEASGIAWTRLRPTLFAQNFGALRTAGAPDWLIDGLAEPDALIKHGHATGVSPAVGDLLGRPPRTFRQYADDLAAGRA